MLSLQEGQYLGLNRQHYALDGLRIVDTVYHQKVSNGWHSHERTHLTYVLDGGNREKRKNNDKQLNAGTLAFYHSGELHCNDHTLFPSRNLNLEIEPAFFERYDLSENLIYTAVKNNSFSAPDFMALFNEALRKDYRSSDSTHMLLLGGLSRPRPERSADWVNSIRNILNDRWKENPSLDELSRETGVHPVTISKHFHQHFGCTFGAYLRKIKIQRSLSMIRSGEFSLSEIAYLCGFSDQSHFIRTFKTHIGALPKDFRQL